MASKLSYRDLSHPDFQDTIKGHNHSTLKLVKTVAEFSQKVSMAHEQFANQVLNVVESYKKKNQELKKERPVDCPSSLSSAWETLLQETQYDAQAHADTATLIMKNVYTPLLEIASYKRSQSKKIYQFRENFEVTLKSAEDNVYKCHNTYIEAYQQYRSNSNSRDASRYLAAYHNSHNEYVLQIRASNRQEQHYHQMALPYLLQELEEIHIDLANTLNGAIESHALLLLTKADEQSRVRVPYEQHANEQSRRFEGILRTCKSVNPKMDVHNFIVCVAQEPSPYEPREFAFNPPSDPNIPGSELSTLKEQMVFDRHTELSVKQKRADLQREAAELTSYLKQNQDVTQTLMNVCQRNLANHLYAKVYETQEDLCRKRNEIRVANLQLAAIRAQIELLSPKQNGSAAVEADGKNKASIKGMWKKAFKSLKSKDKEKDEKPEKPEKGEGKYSRLQRGASFLGFGGRSHDSSKSQNSQPDQDAQSPEVVQGTDLPQKESRFRRYSRQSSLKRVLKRKDSKEASSDGEPTPEGATGGEGPGDQIDPVYSLLKCAADLPRQQRHATGVGPTGHACCVRTAIGGATSNPDNILTIRGSSRSSSPASAPQSPPHRRRKKLNMRMKSFSLDTPEPPKQHAIDETSKKKSSSFTNACFGGQSSGSTAYARRSKFWNRSTSLDTEEMYDSHSPKSNQSLSPRGGGSPGRGSMEKINEAPPSKMNLSSSRRSLPTNLYVVLYNFRGKEKDDLDLRAGWKVNAIDTSDPDWWKFICYPPGKANGKVGYFPAKYVEKVNPGEKVLEVIQGLEISEGDSGIKLLKDQIVIQESEEEDGMVSIRTCDENRARFPCPLKYLHEI